MAKTNWSKVDRLELRLRVGVATRLMDRVAYDAIRAWLATEGVAADELPADRTFRDYLNGAEAKAWTAQRAGDYLREAPGDALATLEERTSTANQARGLCMAMDDLQDRLACSSALRARLAMVRKHVEDAEYTLDALRGGGGEPGLLADPSGALAGGPRPPHHGDDPACGIADDPPDGPRGLPLQAGARSGQPGAGHGPSGDGGPCGDGGDGGAATAAPAVRAHRPDSPGGGARCEGVGSPDTGSRGRSRRG